MELPWDERSRPLFSPLPSRSPFEPAVDVGVAVEGPTTESSRQEASVVVVNVAVGEPADLIELVAVDVAELGM